MNRRTIRRIVDWTLYAVTILYLLTGLGITQYQITEHLTFGLLSKSVSFAVHENLLLPFLILLSLHLLFGPIMQVYSTARRTRARLPATQ